MLMFVVYFIFVVIFSSVQISYCVAFKLKKKTALLILCSYT